MNRRKPKQKRSNEKVLRIREAYLKLLMTRKDYFSWGTQDIAQEVGIAIGTIYSYYSDKESVALDIWHNDRDGLSLEQLKILRTIVQLTGRYEYETV